MLLPTSVLARGRALGALVRTRGRRSSAGRRLAHCRLMITTGPASARPGAGESDIRAPAGTPAPTSKLRPAQNRSLPVGESNGSAIFHARSTSAKARERHSSNGPASRSTLPAKTVTLLRPRLSTASSMKATRRVRRSAREKVRSCRAIASGIPGRPAPEPRSATRPGPGPRRVAPRRESTI